MASYFTERKSGAIRIEGTEGTFETPLAADMKFPLDFEPVSPELNTVEGVKDALGSFTQPRQFPGQITGTTTLMSSLMKVDDTTVATGDFEIAPLFRMSGWSVDSWDDSGTSRVSLLWDGNATCETASARLINVGCGTATQGYGYDVRGMRGSIELNAESTGSEIKVNVPATCAIELESRTHSVIATDYINDAATRATELFLGSFTFDGVATPIESLSIAMNNTQKAKKDPAGKYGVSYVTSTNYEPTMTITCPVGSETDAWWGNATSGKVITTATYVGTYFDIIISNLSIKSHGQEDAEGEVSLTQELSFESIRINAKNVA